MSDLIKASGIWLSDGKNGKYMSGSLTAKMIEQLYHQGGDFKILIFKNDKNDNEKAPQYQMFVAPKNQQGQNASSQSQGTRTQQSQPAAQRQNNTANHAESNEPEAPEDSIPF